MSPRCEACRREAAYSFSWCPEYGWRFTGACTIESEHYYVLLRDHGRGFLDSDAAREDWLEHLAEKTWFRRGDFARMLARFGAAQRRRLKGSSLR